MNRLFREMRSSACRKKVRTARRTFFRAVRHLTHRVLKDTARVALKQVRDEADEDYYEALEAMEPHEDTIEECRNYEEYLHSRRSPAAEDEDDRTGDFVDPDFCRGYATVDQDRTLEI